MAKEPIVADPEVVSTPVADSIDKDGGPQFVLDQMADTLERAKIEAHARTEDLSIRWHHGPDAEDGPRTFSVTRDGVDPLHGLSVDEAKAVLDAFGA